MSDRVPFEIHELKMSDYQAKIRRIKGSILGDIFLNLIVIGQGH